METGGSLDSILPAQINSNSLSQRNSVVVGNLQVLQSVPLNVFSSSLSSLSPTERSLNSS